MLIDRTNSKPLHLQLEEVIRMNLAKQIWKPGQMIPSENEFSRTYEISRMTVRSVITRLVQEGILIRIAGKGTFVSEPKITAQSLVSSGISSQLEQMGYEISTEVLSVEKRTVSENTFEEFKCDSTTEFWIIKRRRFFKQKPFSLVTSCVPAYLCPGLEKKDLQNVRLYDVLSSHYGLYRSKTIETLESITPSSSETECLQLKKNQPLLLLKDYIFDSENRLFEYDKVVFIGNMIKLRFEYHWTDER